MSTTLPSTLETSGARHQLPARSRLKTATSMSCPTRNAVPEPIATRKLTSGPNGPSICAPTKLQRSPTTKPATTTFRAAAGPCSRFIRSVTRKANG